MQSFYVPNGLLPTLSSVSRCQRNHANVALLLFAHPQKVRSRTWSLMLVPIRKPLAGRNIWLSPKNHTPDMSLFSLRPKCILYLHYLAVQAIQEHLWERL